MLTVIQRFWWVGLALVVAVGCEKAASLPPPQTPEVVTTLVQSQSVVLSRQLPGRTASYLVADVRPQVNGVILKRLFEEGSEVKEGQLLYQVDPAPYEAAFQRATAQVAAAKQAVERAKAALDASLAAQRQQEAVVHLARTNLERYEKMFRQDATTAMQRDQAATDAAVAESALQGAIAQVESDRRALAAAQASAEQAEAEARLAQINLDYTEVKAPISGRIGRSNVTEGAIVTAYQAIPLATIQQFDPIYADVPQSTAEVNQLRRHLEQGRMKTAEGNKVKIILEDDSTYPHEGTLMFRDVTVDPSTESVVLRVVVPNPEGELLPGMFIRVSVTEGVRDNAILVPQQAVQRDFRAEPYVFVVGKDNKIEQRHIVLDRTIGHDWLVESGLNPGEQIVMEGFQKIRAGAVVKVIPMDKKAEAGQGS